MNKADQVVDLLSSTQVNTSKRRIVSSSSSSSFVPTQVITLDDDDDPKHIPAVASLPQIISLLDSDDDDDDNNNNNNNKNDYKNKRNNFKSNTINSGNLDKKPRAKSRDRKRPRTVPVEIVHLVNEESTDLDQKRSAKPSSSSSSSLRTQSTIQDATPAIIKVIPAPEKPKTPLERLYEVFPDVDDSFAQKTLRDCSNNLEMVLSILAERSYPKNKNYEAMSRSATNLPSSVIIKRAKVQPKYDYTSPSSFSPSPKYVQEALSQLLHDFSFMTIRGVQYVLHKHMNHYTLARNSILDILKGSQHSKKNSAAATTTHQDERARFQAFKVVWATKHPTPQQIQQIGQRNCLKRPIRRPTPTITDPILLEEVQFAKGQLEEWMSSMEDQIKREEARRRSTNTGCGVECGCCFDKVPIEEMVACRDEGHLFCADCIQNYATTQVFSNGSLGVVKATGKQSCELLCCDSSGCQSGFQEGHLQKALSSKLLEKYHELVFRAIVEAAGIQDEICSCPKCGFQADLPLNLVVFQCPVEDCRYESCRKCGKEPHIPLRCEEVVQQKRQDEGRLKVEEAMAQAKIRKCPKCSTSFVKSDGCNKMTCRCGANMCYICRKELKEEAYSHFCNVPHCNHKTCQSCVLFTNAEQDDQQAIREAGLTAAKDYNVELKQKENDGPDVQIDVDGIMRQGVQTKAQAASTKIHRGPNGRFY